jgi:hypothetical protein
MSSGGTRIRVPPTPLDPVIEPCFAGKVAMDGTV